MKYAKHPKQNVAILKTGTDHSGRPQRLLVAGVIAFDTTRVVSVSGGVVAHSKLHDDEPLASLYLTAAQSPSCSHL